MHLRRWIILGGLLPSLAVTARILYRAGTLMVVVWASAALAALLHRGPDPALVRAACAARVATDAGLALIPILDLDAPGARSLRDAMAGRAAQAREAWDVAPVECEP